MRKLTLLILCISLLMTTSSCSDEPKTITGNEWLLKQEDCFTDLEAFATGMDQVYTLYISGSITSEDFANEHYVLCQQYKLLAAFYDDLKKQNPLEPESHSFLSKKGTDAMEGIYTSVEELLNASLDDAGTPLPPNQILYKYLAVRQTLTDHIATFVTAIQWYKSETGMYDDIDTTSTSNGEA